MKILIVVTNVGIYKTKNLQTGLWLSELTHFYDKAKKQNFDIVIASQQGGNTPIDPESIKPMLLDKLTKKYMADSYFMSLLQNTKSLNDAAQQNFDCVYLTGGHGTMYDFTNDTTLQEIIKRHYEKNKIVSAICHGVCGFLNVKLTNGEYLIKDKILTGYSWFEETLANRKKVVPFNLEAELKYRKADYKKATIPLTSNVREDKNLITGQNPFSSKAIAEIVVKRLTEKK